VDSESADVDGCIVIMKPPPLGKSASLGGRHVTLYHAAPRQIEVGLTNRPAYASRAHDSYITESRHGVTIAA
jgi:hypothetical protein